jgi:hypothetical protein
MMYWRGSKVPMMIDFLSAIISVTSIYCCALLLPRHNERSVDRWREINKEKDQMSSTAGARPWSATDIDLSVVEGENAVVESFEGKFEGAGVDTRKNGVVGMEAEGTDVP